MSFLKQIRDCATSLPVDDPRRVMLKDFADNIHDNIRLLQTQIDTTTMQRLVSLWTRASVLMENISRQDTPPPTGGSMPIPLQLAA